MKRLSWRSILKRVEGRRTTGLWCSVEDGYLRLELGDGSVLLVAASWEGCHVMIDTPLGQSALAGDKTGTKPRSYHQHRLWTLRAALEEFGSEKWLDHIGPTGVALRAWKESLIEDLGGWDNLSTQQLALVDLVVRQMLLIENVDQFVIANQAIVNKRNRKLFRVMLDRQRMADSLAKYLQMLGLERRAPESHDLSSYIATTYGEGKDDSSDDT